MFHFSIPSCRVYELNYREERASNLFESEVFKRTQIIIKLSLAYLKDRVLISESI